MMNCSKVRNLLSAYVDEELDPREMLAVRTHLENCRACCAECDEIRSMREVLHRLPAKPVPPELLSRIRSRLEEADEGVLERVHPGLGAAAALAAAAAVIGFVLYSWTHSSREVPIAGEAPGMNGRQLDGVRDFERSRSPFSSHSIPVSLDDHSWGR
jgi:anti-sigma factor RsiW